MSIQWKNHLSWGALALASAVLVACGGGDPVGPKVAISRVMVAGDSLADAGTFGFKFTVQNAADPKGYPIWPQLVENVFGLDGSAQCNYYNSATAGETYEPNSTSCLNYAVGGGRVIVGIADTKTSGVNPEDDPKSVIHQLKTLAANQTYTAGDLLLIDGGGNDLADLATFVLTAQQAGLAAQADPTDAAKVTAAAVTAANLVAFLEQQLPTGRLQQLQVTTGANAPALAGGEYTTKLAETFYAAIQAEALDKGAKHVAILNAPDITLTPLFKAQLDGIRQFMGDAAALQVQGMIQNWAQQFNQKLADLAAGESRVALVDFYADFADQGANPGDYMLTNATEAACPNGFGTLQAIQACSDLALNMAPNKTAGWWETYAFSDGFHPTPYGHQLLAASVNRALARAGWL